MVAKYLWHGGSPVFQRIPLTREPIWNQEQLFALLDEFKIETPSWGFADTGTRFGKFLQPAAASTVDEKLADAGIVHKYTGCCPTVAVHVEWDFSMGVDATATADLAIKNGVKIGQRSIPTSFRIRSIRSDRYAMAMNPCGIMPIAT